MADLSTLLANCGSPHAHLREEAEEYLRSWEEADFGGFLSALAEELASDAVIGTTRQMAGLMLKNALGALLQDEVAAAQREQAWLALPDETTLHIKEIVFNTLGSAELDAAHTAAQAIGVIGSIDYPAGKWDTVFDMLLDNVQSEESTESRVAYSLEALGFLCDEIDRDVVSQELVNRVLGCIEQGITNEAVRSEHIKLAATQALLNSLDFARNNMATDADRGLIMGCIYSAAEVKQLRVRVVAFQCAVRVAMLYYDYMAEHMGDLYEITTAAVREDNERVGMQALEFWCSICDTELERIKKAEAESARRGVEVKPEIHGFISDALPYLVPLLTETMTKQDELQSEDTWNISMAGATCLALVAQVVGGAVIELVMPFIAEIEQDDWRMKEAAALAFGSILDGPSSEELQDLVNQSLPVMFDLLGFDHSLVQDTAAWTIGRICDLHADVISPDYFDPLLENLLTGLDVAEPRVAANLCYALHNLAAAFEGWAGDSTLLTPRFRDIVARLLMTIDREEWDEFKLREAAFDALNLLTQTSHADDQELVYELLGEMMARLSATFDALDSGHADTAEQLQLQVWICGVLHVSCQQLKDRILDHTDDIMHLLLRVFHQEHATAHEEAMLVVMTILSLLGADFAAYLDEFWPVLSAALANSADYHTCGISIHVTGELARTTLDKEEAFAEPATIAAFEESVMKQSHFIMQTLAMHLSDPTVHRKVQPPAISCIGDMALMMGAAFPPYLEGVMSTLLEAASFEPEDNDEDELEYAEALRLALVEAFVGITQGLGTSQMIEPLEVHAVSMLQYVKHIASLPVRSEDLTRQTVGLTADLVTYIGRRAAAMVDEYVDMMIRAAVSSESEDMHTMGALAQEALEQMDGA